MHLRDRLEEIRSIVRSIYRRYETPFDSVARSKIGITHQQMVQEN